ncbi:DNA-directed RNA polymerase [Vibrio sp. WXL210]|uniref:DNA-directed RNA polymerase n=1 Tax=Vibrio sp. WXL210 TaxID=3450709 RepID=UPI003EC8E356
MPNIWLCNGVQHLTALTRDHRVAPHVGLIRTEERGDVYQYVLDHSIQLLESMDDAIATEWIKSGLMERKLAKTPVMTLAYGATLYGIKEGIRDFIFDKKGDDRFADGFGSANWMGEQLWDVMGNHLQGATSFMKWVQAVSDAFSSVNRPFHWTTPNGFKCVQREPKFKTKRVQATLRRGDTVRLNFNEPTNDINGRKSRQSASPNLIHSFDGSHLSLTVNRAADEYGVRSFAMCHDSFGGHADDAPYILQSAKEVWADMYSVNHPQRLYDEWCEQMEEAGEHFGLVPQYSEFFTLGDLDSREVVGSDFFFA